MWIIISMIIGVVLLVQASRTFRTVRKTGWSKGSGQAHGLAIGMFLTAIVCIILRELGGYRDAVQYLLPCGIAVGALIGFLLERLYVSQR